MKLDLIRVKSVCEQRGVSVAEMLREAGVSRNAFYSLARRESVVPSSITSVANQLEIPVSEMLTPPISPTERMVEIAEEASRIIAQHPDADWDNLRHTLVLLDEEPVERLRGALRRGRQLNLR